MSERELFHQAADYAADFVETLDTRPIRAEADVEELLAALGGALPEEGLDPRAVVAALVEEATPGVVAMPSGRYFGFVIGGAVPAAVAADWLASVWDQNAGLYAGGPSAAVVEEVCRALAGGAARTARRRVGCVCDRLPDGARHRARRGAPSGARAGRLGRLPRRARRRAADPRPRRREAPCDDRPRAAAPRYRLGVRRSGAGRRPGAHARRRAARFPATRRSCAARPAR